MKVLIIHTANHNRIEGRLRSYGHIGLTSEEVDSPDDYDAVILGSQWADCPLCRNIRHEAVVCDKIIAYESDLDRLDMRTLRDHAATPRHKYRTLETTESILVQVRGKWFGVWHTVKEYHYAADPAYARLLASELIDKLTDD